MEVMEYIDNIIIIAVFLIKLYQSEKEKIKCTCDGKLVLMGTTITGKRKYKCKKCKSIFIIERKFE